jgi:beta-lactamase class A
MELPMHGRLDRRRVLVGAATSLVASSAFAAGETPRETEATTKLVAIETKVGGRIGVAALDTGSGKRIDRRADQRFPLCSTFKLLAAAAVLRRVDDGKEKLDRLVPYGESDLLSYAPVTKQHVSEGAMTLAALCEAAIEVSDNTAGNLLLATLGGPAGLTAYLRSIGDQTTRLDRTEPTLNTALPGDERDTTTPSAMLGSMQVLLLGKALSSGSRERLEGWLGETKTGAGLIRAGVPADWHVGDKTGRGDNNAWNDVAILRPPGRAPVLLTVYTVEQTAPDDLHKSAIADTVRIAIEALL